MFQNRAPLRNTKRITAILEPETVGCQLQVSLCRTVISER